MSSSLSTLGIPAAEEAIYRALLRAPGVTIDRLGDELQLEEKALRAHLVQLARIGFVTHSPEAPRRYFPAPPDMAVGGLILERQKGLRDAQDRIAELQLEAHQAQREVAVESVVEIITSEQAAQMPYLQIHRGAQKEVISLVRPPFRVSSPHHMEEARVDACRRNVRYRNIVDPKTLALPGWPRMLQQAIEYGEEIRLLSEFPFKMVAADGRYGLIPLHVDEPSGPLLMLRASAVLDALCELFEKFWERAAPIGFSRSGTVTVHERKQMFDDELDSLVALLATGMKDKAVAHQAGLSERTLLRRIDQLYEKLDARSRFQAGWLAALRAMAHQPGSA